jgi:hypothetical protein
MKTVCSLKWFFNNAEELNVDRKNKLLPRQRRRRIITALALLARDRKGPEIVFSGSLISDIDDRI